MKKNEIDLDETLDDVLSLCAKILHDHEVEGKVKLVDLLEIRDAVNNLRRGICGGQGYKAVPRLIKSED